MTGAGDKLILAVPSKGRLQENASNFFARAGLVLQQGRGSRDYSGSLVGVADVEVLFLSASEISATLASGGAHLGVTGEDLIRENIADADAKVELLTPLGFGQANVVVAVPQAWIDVRTMADLEDVSAAFHARHGRRMRVATKYLNLTREFFARHGVSDYRIVESLGATEGAPASGTAELIVDITTTGATLAANRLKILEDGTILQSEANLVASVTAPWAPQARLAARAILSRIAAEERARTQREVRARFPSGEAPALGEQAATDFGAALMRTEPCGDLVLHVPQRRAADLAGWLIEQGAETAIVTGLDYVFSRQNLLDDKLAARIG
jgi:ATP phosphoribosyltransferase